jgi:hypothetical protein
VLAGILAVVGAAGLVVGVFAAWAHDVAEDPETYEQASVLRLNDGGLEAMVGDRITEALMSWADLDARIGSALPGPLGSLGGPAESLTGRVLDETIAAVLAQPAIRSTIDQMEDRVDRELVDLLLDDSTLLRVEDDLVVLDLDPLIADVIGRIDDAIPSMFLRLAPDLSVEVLLPGAMTDGGVELVIGEVPALADAAAGTDRLDDLAARLPWVGVALVLGALALSPRRLEAVQVAGGAALVTSLLVLMGAFGSSGWPLTGAIAPIEAVAGTAFTDLDGATLTIRLLLLGAVGAVAAAAPWAWGRRAGAEGSDPAPAQ